MLLYVPPGVDQPPVGVYVPGGGSAARGPSVLSARLHLLRDAGAALPLRGLPRQPPRHQEAADMARAAHTRTYRLPYLIIISMLQSTAGRRRVVGLPQRATQLS